MSMASDLLLGEDHVGLHPAEPIHDANNQTAKPSPQASLTQTTEKIVIHVTDHSDNNKGEEEYDRRALRWPADAAALNETVACACR